MIIVSVVGARPQFVKLGPVAEVFSANNVEHIVVHTGQHYDVNMSDNFFRDLGIPSPDFHLGVGSGRHGEQTGRMLEKLESVLGQVDPDWLLVYGDTNSTLAAAIAGVKMHIPVAHLEAGLRSFNRRMPEEHNRILTDHAADLCLAPTVVAASHLAREGLGKRTIVTGDVMTDVCLKVAREVEATRAPNEWGDRYLFATIHRAENTDDDGRLREIIDALSNLDRRVVLAAHPRLIDKAARADIALNRGSLVVTEPMDYPDLIRCVLGSDAVITDSGGLQKEAFLLRVPCVTVRTETEWVETVEAGWNVLCPDPSVLAECVDNLSPAPTSITPYGDGSAAQKVFEALASGANSRY